MFLFDQLRYEKKIELIYNDELRTDRAAEKKLLVSPVTTLLDP